MKNKKLFKIISIIFVLICILFLSVFLRYKYELHSLKNEIVNNEVIKVYFDGSGYTANLESDVNLDLKLQWKTQKNLHLL